MKLPQTSEYALRVMAQLALLDSSKSTRSEKLAELTGIPLPFISKVLRRMVNSDLLVSKKGVGGGFTFARPLKKIRMIDILQAAGYKFDTDHCVFGWNRCHKGNPCPLHDSWKEMKQSFEDWAENTTLADVKKL